MMRRFATSLLQPDLVLSGSILALTPELLQRYHLKGLVLDVDETLVPRCQPDVAPDILTWFQSIRQQVQIWLVSNNLNYHRIRHIAQTLDVPFHVGAAKPSRRCLRLAVAHMGLPYHQVAMVGDRLFTDVIAGNRLGMFTILVEPVPLLGATMANNQPLRNFEVWLSQLLGASLKESSETLH